MRSTNLFRFTDNKPVYLAKTLLPFIFFTLLSIPLLCLYFYPLSFAPFSTSPITNHSSPPAPPPPEKPRKAYVNSTCDYRNGEWVRDERDALYNATTCKIQKGQNCIINGRPDLGYLHWKWKPKECNLPRFEPHTFLQLVKNKHVAFVGDSLSRNQIESLVCLLSTTNSTKPRRVHHRGSRRWHFPSHNANLSFYWSPFLVQGAQKRDTGPHYNSIYLDHVNERWGRDMHEMDLIVLSFGHWLLIPSIYYEGGSVVGCLNCPGLNYTDIGFYGPLRKALRFTLYSIIERRRAEGKKIDVIMRTFSPSHFEGDWDKGGTCSMSKPYRKGEKKLEGMDAKIRRIEIEELEDAKVKAKQFGGFRFEVMDITQLALLRPDGHPGPYMNPFPFANGVVQERVQSDCSHWCLPGPIDTWNEIFLEMMKKWEQ